MSPIAITHCAFLTPLDSPTQSTWEALCQDRRVGANTHITDSLLDPDDSLDRSIRLALAAARRVPVDASAALFAGTSKGPVLTHLAALEKLRHGEALTQAEALHVALGASALAVLARERLGLIAPAHTSIAACSSGLHALERAVRALHRGECTSALVLAADASHHPLFEGSFARLGVLAPADAAGVRTCIPFSPRGDGFFIAEAAVALVLESPARLAGRTPLCWIDSIAIAGDGTDLIAVDPRTASLRRLLESTTNPAPAFVHAHATGTAHDTYELAAIRTAFCPNVPVFSHKKWLGHSLGAAGLLSAALSATCHYHRRTPCGMPVPPGVSSITIAQGFGGHIAVAKLRSV